MYKDIIFNNGEVRVCFANDALSVAVLEVCADAWEVCDDENLVDAELSGSADVGELEKVWSVRRVSRNNHFARGVGAPECSRLGAGSRCICPIQALPDRRSMPMALGSVLDVSKRIFVTRVVVKLRQSW